MHTFPMQMIFHCCLFLIDFCLLCCFFVCLALIHSIKCSMLLDFNSSAYAVAILFSDAMCIWWTTANVSKILGIPCAFGSICSAMALFVYHDATLWALVISTLTYKHSVKIKFRIWREYTIYIILFLHAEHVAPAATIHAKYASTRDIYSVRAWSSVPNIFGRDNNSGTNRL